MRRPYLLISGAYLGHALAWFLPVVKDGMTLPKGLPGWEAFRVAFSVVWPDNGSAFDEWYYATFATISAVATIVFIFGSPWVVLRGSSSVRRISAWIAALAFLDNLWWFILWSPKSELRIGYYLWCFSFLVLAIGLLEQARDAKSGSKESATTISAGTAAAKP